MWQCKAFAGGARRVELAELEALARAFGLPLPALMVLLGRTVPERAKLVLLEGD